MTCDLCGGSLVPLGVLGTLSWFRCRQCGMDWSIDESAERDIGLQPSTLESSADAAGEWAIDARMAERGQMHEASEADFSRWAERYDDLNGAPENEEDR